jgi:hypothetical protein
MTKKTKRNPLALFVSLAIVGIAIFLIFKIPNKPVSAAWYDDTWAYRTRISLSTVTATNSKVKLDIDTAALITAGKIQADCGDSRFTTQNGELLRYYLDAAGGACNTNSTDYYVLIPTIDNPTVIYHYYGNASAPNGTEGVNFSEATVSPTAASATEEKSAGPISYWKFDEGTGDSTYDDTSQANTLSITNAVWKDDTLCVSGKCLFFDDSGDYARKTYSSDSELDPGTGSFTISTWAKHSTTAGDDMIVTRLDAKSGVGWKLYMNSSGFLCFGIDQTAGSFPNDVACTTTSYADAKWHHVVGVKTTTSKISLFVDGTLAAEDVSITASSITGTNSNFTVGNDWDVASNGWTGFIDEIKYYNFARSSTQINSDFATRGSGESISSMGTANPISSLNQGLVGYWKMDESGWTSDCSTQSVIDTSGNAKHGRACPNGAAASPASGKFGNAVNLNGSTQYLNGGTGFNFTTSFSVSAWFTTTNNLLGESIISTMAGNGARGWKLLNDSGGLASYVASTSTATHYTYTTVGIENNTWYHAVMVYDASIPAVKIYQDGVDYTGVYEAIPSSLYNNGQNLNIGRDPSGSSSWSGKIDEVRVYNRALNKNEVANLYNFAPPTIGYWKFDERSGTTPSDSSALSQTGSFTGSPTWISGKFGNGLKFDGSSQAVSATITDPGYSNTVEAWIYPTSSVASKTIITSGKLATDSSSQPTYGSCTGTAIPLNTWTHIAATSTDSTHCAIYQNGVKTSSSAVTGVTFGTSVNIGASSFAGTIDEVKIYNYPRTDKNVVEDMNAGHPNVGSPVGSAAAHYKFDEGADNTCIGGTNDVCNSGSQATTLDGTSTATRTNTGKFNKALDFDGSDDVATITNVNAIDFDTSLSTGVTFSAWVNPDTVGEGSAGEIFRKSATTYCRLSGSTSFTLTCSLDLSTDATVAISSLLPASTWTHVALTWSDDLDDEITLWINGVKRGVSINGAGPVSADSSNLLIGGGTSNNFDGKIDEFKVYSYELSENEIKVDYNRGSSLVMGTEDSGQHLADGAGNAPTLEWRLDEKSGQTVYDTSGNGSNESLGANNSVASDDPSWTRGKIGSALNFDGSNDYVADGSLDATYTGNLTLTLWFNTSATQLLQARMAELGQTAGNGIQPSMATNGTVLFDNSGGPTSSVSTSTAKNDGKWHFLAITRSSTTYSLYLDNEFIGSSGGTAPTYTKFYLGSGISNANFNGTIDQVKIYNYARTTTQLAFDYNEGAPVGWWKFDECQGLTAYDSSPNSNGGFNGSNGTLSFGDATGNNDSAGACNSGASGTTNEMWNAGTTGKYNASVSLDGTNDNVEVTGNTRLMLTGDMSYSIWFNATSISNSETILSYRNGPDDILANNVLYSLTWNTAAGNDFRIQHENGAGVNNNIDFDVNLSAGVWYFITVTRTVSTNTYQVYVDGRLAGTKTYSNDPEGGTSSNLYIGSEEGKGNPFDGQIDDFRIFNYVLSANQVKQLMVDGSSVRFGPATGMP